MEQCAFLLRILGARHESDVCAGRVKHEVRKCDSLPPNNFPAPSMLASAVEPARTMALSPLRKRLVGQALVTARGAPHGLYHYMKRHSAPFAFLPVPVGRRVCALAHSHTLATLGSRLTSSPVLAQIKSIYPVAHAMAVEELESLVAKSRDFLIRSAQQQQRPVHPLPAYVAAALQGRRRVAGPSPLRHSWVPPEPKDARPHLARS